jgi:hypothetical protein
MDKFRLSDGPEQARDLRQTIFIRLLGKGQVFVASLRFARECSG